MTKDKLLTTKQEEQLNGVCEDSTHEVCFLKKDFVNKWIPKYELKKKWLEFKDETIPEHKTHLFMVKNKENNCGLGFIKWDTGWRQYVFTDGDLKLAEGCLYEMFEKIRQLRIERALSRAECPDCGIGSKLTYDHIGYNPPCLQCSKCSKLW